MTFIYNMNSLPHVCLVSHNQLTVNGLHMTLRHLHPAFIANQLDKFTCALG